MNIVKWSLRVIFLWIPIVFIVGYCLFCGLVLPFFFGDGMKDFWKFVEKDNAELIAVQFVIQLTANFLYERIWNFAGYIRRSIVAMLMRCVDAFYDKLLGGPFGRGESGTAVVVAAGVYCICICFGGFMLAYFFCYLYEGLSVMSFSWDAWMQWTYAERITYRWMPLTLGLVFLTEPLLHVIDRPIRGVIEKTMGYFKENKKKKSDDFASVEEVKGE